MILDAILNVLSNVFSLVLSPLDAISFSIDIWSSIGFVANFIKVIAYIFPWNNILPIIVISFLIINFRNIIGTIVAVLNLIPVVR